MDLEKIGNRIRYLRINYTNLTQEEFARNLGYDRAYLSRVESGKQNLTVESLIKICSRLNISLKDFFDFDKFEFNKTR